MHTERYRVPEATWRACADARRVVAVGTTSVRALESAARTGRLEGRTDLFLHRGADFRVVDVLLTNFHLPRTTLLVLIDAFVGPRWRHVVRSCVSRGLPIPDVWRRNAPRSACVKRSVRRDRSL